jgi:outer membrane protein OmpA-like peptidoglycan-associated protein
MLNRSFWLRVLIITITGANLVMFYYSYSRRPTNPQPPTAKEQPKTIPTPKAKEQPSQVTNEIKEQEGLPSTGQQVQSASSPIAVIRFESSNLVLTPQAQTDLLDVFNIMSQKPSMKVEVGGYTDSVGDPMVNIRLSVDRANYVKEQLVKVGISADRIIVQGHGPTDFVADNKTPEGRALNRRVEITVKSE